METLLFPVEIKQHLSRCKTTNTILEVGPYQVTYRDETGKNTRVEVITMPYELSTQLTTPLRILSSPPKKRRHTETSPSNKRVRITVCHYQPMEEEKTSFCPDFEEEENTPLETAETEYQIESIVDHIYTGDKRKKQHAIEEYDFLIKWKEYDSSENLWLPYEEIKHTLAFETYCQQHNLPCKKYV